MKRLLFAIVFATLMIHAGSAQTFRKKVAETLATTFEPAFSEWEVGVNLGTTGIGVDVETPLTEMVKARAGFSFMPVFKYNMNFGVDMRDKNGQEIANSTFDKMATMLEQFTGTKVDKSIDMVGKPQMWNAKLLFDVYPFSNKHWFVTAGFYVGQSTIAKAENVIEDAPSLVAIAIYNRMYMKALNNEPFATVGEIDVRNPDLQRKLLEYGRIGVKVGEYGSGIPTVIEPDENDMVKVLVKTNPFKPYLGFGYRGCPFSDKSIKMGFDAGILLWGGKPCIKTTATDYQPTITTDEWGSDVATYETYDIDLGRDVVKVYGKPGTYVDFMKFFVVYPVLEFRISKSF